MSQSISNQTHTQLFCSTPQRSETVSTIGRPHPPLRPGCGRGSDAISKPGPESHTLPRTEPAETLTVSEIWSFGESPAWRILFVTSSLTTSRTSSSFSGGKWSASRSRVWRAVATTSGSGASLRSISASIDKSQRIGQHGKPYVPSSRVVTRRMAVQLLYWRKGGASARLTISIYSFNYYAVAEVGMPERSERGSNKTASHTLCIRTLHQVRS
jgi:hypothetical protein